MSTAEDSTANATTPEGDTAARKKIAERLFFFFSDANIRQDAFMRRYLLVGGKKSPTDDPFMGTGKIPITLLLKFHTIQALTDSTALIESVVTTECAKVLKVVTLEEAAVVPKDGSTTATTKTLCIERMTPFTKDLLHGHLSRSLYVSQLPLTPDGTKYAISQEELRALFTPLLSVTTTTPPSTDTATTTTDTGSSNIENNSHNNNETENGIALIKFKFQPSHPNNNNHHHHKNDSNQKWQPTGGAMMEFTNVTTLQRVAEQTLTTNPDHPPKVPLYYQPPTGSSSNNSSDDPNKILLQVMLYSDYHKQERREYSSNSGDKSDTHRNDDDQPDAFTMDWKPGCVIRIQGISNAKEEKTTDDAVVSTTTQEEIHCDRECLLELLAHGLQRKDMETLREEKIVYVDYSRGQDHGAIRCDDPQHISTIYKVLQQLVVVTPNVAGEPTDVAVAEEEEAATKEGKEEEESTTEPVVDAVPAAAEPTAVASKDKIPNRHRLQFESVTILSGGEERQYWNDFIAFKNQQMNNQQRHSSNSKRKSNSSSSNNNYNKRSKHSHRR